jgi:hypothetical protein
MASIITATTSSGLTQSADTSGVLQLASGTGNLVTIPSVTGTAMVSGNMPAFSAYNSTGTSLTGSANTKVLFQTEEFDTNSNFASSTFTPTVAGYYQITANVQWGTATESQCYIYKNGSNFKQGTNIATSTKGCAITALIYMNGTTDYLEIYVFVGSTYTTQTGATTTYFQGCLVRAA